MSKEAAELQRMCPICQQFAQPEEARFVEQVLDWRLPYIELLKDGILPEDRADASALKKRAPRFFMLNEELYRHGYHRRPLRCIGPSETEQVLRMAHEPGHLGGAKLYDHLMTLGYYWPSMEVDATKFVKKCLACQLHGNLIHAPSVELHSLSTPYPFHTWAFDLVGKIVPPARGKIWILAATEQYTKWVEAVALKNATGPVVASFIKEHVICRFGIPKVILTDNGKQFVNKEVGLLTNKYGITHHCSTVAYPKGNGQAEATNKTLLQILAKMRDDFPGKWDEHLNTALWAYRTSKRKPTGFTPFALVYGAEAVLPVELAVPSARMALQNNLLPDARHVQLEALDEHRDQAKKNFQVYLRQLSRAYDALVKPREFKVGDLVLKASTHHIRGISGPKFTPNWEGPFVVKEVSSSGYCVISKLDSDIVSKINCKWLKKYYV